MPEPTHKCASTKCSKQIPEDKKFCVPCGLKLNQKGLCAMCGEKPRKPKSPSAKQSKHCVECQKIAQQKFFERSALETGSGPRYRPPEARENTRETKRGLDR